MSEEEKKLEHSLSQVEKVLGTLMETQQEMQRNLGLLTRRKNGSLKSPCLPIRTFRGRSFVSEEEEEMNSSEELWSLLDKNPLVRKKEDSIQYIPPVQLGSAEGQRPSTTSLLKFEADGDSHIILPDTTPRMLLHTVLILIMMFDLIDVSWSSAQKGWWSPSIDPNRAFYIGWSLAEAVPFFVEMCLNFKTAYVKNWELIDNDVTEVQFRYLKTWFAFDLITWIPVDLICIAFSMTAYRVARVAKLIRSVRVPFMFPKSSPLKEQPKIVTIILFSYYNIAGLTILSALWLALASSDEINGNVASNVTDIEQVTFSVYFIVTTFTSVGYGDITPNSVHTIWFSIIVQLLGVGFLVYVGAVSTAFFIGTDPYEASIEEKKKQLTRLLDTNDIPWVLQKQCFTILPSILESWMKDHNSVLQELPPFMQDRIKYCIKAKMVKSVPLFNGVEPDAIHGLIQSLKTTIVPPRTELVSKGELGNEMFFIHRGCVEVTIPSLDGDQWIATLKEDSWFGEVALIRESERNATVRTITACEVFTLDKGPFLTVVDSSPKLAMIIKDQIETRMMDIKTHADYSNCFESRKLRSGTICTDQIGPSSGRNSLTESKASTLDGGDPPNKVCAQNSL